MLRKLKQQKAFPACSLSFCCTFIRFGTQNNKKSNNKNFKDWDGTETFSLQISNSKRALTKFKLKGKSIKMLRKFRL